MMELAAGTAMNRTKWHQVRQAIGRDSSTNAESLHLIESALFHVWLDDETSLTDQNAEGKKNLS